MNQRRGPRRICSNRSRTPPWEARYFRKAPASIAIVDSTASTTSPTGTELRFLSSMAIFSIATPHRPSGELCFGSGSACPQVRLSFGRRRRALGGVFWM